MIMNDFQADESEIINEIPAGLIVCLFSVLGFIFSLISFIPTLVAFAKIDIIWNFLLLLISLGPFWQRKNNFIPSIFQKSAPTLALLGFLTSCGHFFFTKHPWLS